MAGNKILSIDGGRAGEAAETPDSASPDRDSPDELKARIAELEAENAALRDRLRITDVVMDNVPAVITVRDADGEYVYASRQISEHVKRDRAATPSGEPVRENVAAAAMRKLAKEVAQTGKAVIGLERPAIYSETGTWLTNIVPVKDADGRIIYTVNVNIDVSDRKAAEAALAEARETHAGELEQRNAYLQSILDNDPAIISIRDEEDRYVFANKKFEEQFNVTKDDYLGRTSEEIIGPQAREHWPRIKRVLETGEPLLDVERESVLSGGIWASSVIRIPAADGMGVNALVISKDITERKAREAELREKSAMLEVMFDNLPMQLSLKDRDGRYLMVNPRLTGIPGKPKDYILGKTTFEAYGRDTAKTLDSMTETVVRTGEPIRNHERENKYRPGMFLSTDLIPVKNAKGEVEYVVTLSNDISVLKQREAELRKQSAVLEVLFNELPIQVSLKDAEGRYVLANRRLVDNGRSVNADLIGKTMTEAYGTETARMLDAMLDKVIAGGEPVRNFDRMDEFTPDRYLSTDIVPVTDDAGKLEYIVMISSDVTDRKQYEAELREKSAVLEVLFNHLPMQISLKDGDGKYILANQLVVNNGSAPMSELVGKTTFEAFGTDVSRMLTDMVGQVIASGEPIRNFGRRHAVDPNLFMSTDVIPVKDETGHIEYVVMMSTDVTERKKYEVELREKTALLEVLFEHLPMQISLKDKEGKYLITNSKLSSRAPVPPDEMIGRTVYEVFGTDISRKISGMVADVAKTGEPVWHFDRPHSSLPDVYLSSDIIPIKNDADNVEYVVMMSADISERRRAERELENHRDHLAELVEERTAELRAAQDGLIRSERLATIGQMTATVGHELRNPLGTLRTTFYSLRNQLGVHAADYGRLLDRVNRSIHRCDTIIEELLNYTQLSDTRLANVDVDKWCQMILEDLDLPADCVVQTHFDCGVKTALDRERMVQVLENLIQNAWQAGTDVNGTQIHMSTAAADGGVEIRLWDNGAGIPPEDRERVFEPLFSTKPSGIGLGLPLVRRIIELHDGNIWVEDAPGGQGACFVIRLPVRRVT